MEEKPISDFCDKTVNELMNMDPDQRVDAVALIIKNVVSNMDTLVQQSGELFDQRRKELELLKEMLNHTTPLRIEE
jgi:hypothetical protein